MMHEATTGEPRRVLVTGAAGAIGVPVAAALAARGHHVRGLDRVAMPGLEDQVVGDIADRAAVDRAMCGIDTLIHLAAYPNPADFLDTLLRPNVVGLYHVVASAVAAKVRRIVLASSMQVVSGHDRPAKDATRPARIATGVRAPTNFYALTKLWAEDLGEMIAREQGIEVIAARIGFLPRNPATAKTFVERPAWREFYLSHDDASRFFVCAVESAWPDDADQPPYLAAYVMGPGDGPAANRHDRGPSEALGFVPRDVFPAGLPFTVPGA